MPTTLGIKNKKTKIKKKNLKCQAKKAKSVTKDTRRKTAVQRQLQEEKEKGQRGGGH